ncbi:hypothetical protein F2Q69_00043311 [Brassica cretica]|uniref:Secreted protein n=1 Tax=Brassica cretica TaxID=69181 RepID=A0A8S9NK69_BRACR|nr:hypothetical protein F2Q69_00043311 [Brassica cretica]
MFSLFLHLVNPILQPLLLFLPSVHAASEDFHDARIFFRVLHAPQFHLTNMILHCCKPSFQLIDLRRQSRDEGYRVAGEMS